VNTVPPSAPSMWASRIVFASLPPEAAATGTPRRRRLSATLPTFDEGTNHRTAGW
jgi:hypothetical protein